MSIAVTPRAEVLRDLGTLDTPRVAEPAEVRTLIERVPLWGRGIGWVDAHLLASALLDRPRPSWSHGGTDFAQSGTIFAADVHRWIEVRPTP